MLEKIGRVGRDFFFFFFFFTFFFMKNNTKIIKYMWTTHISHKILLSLFGYP